MQFFSRPSPDTKKSGTAGGDSSYDGGATTSTVEAGDVGAGLAASSSSISSSRQSLQSGDVVVESRPSGRPGKMAGKFSVNNCLRLSVTRFGQISPPRKFFSSPLNVLIAYLPFGKIFNLLWYISQLGKCSLLNMAKTLNK